MGGFYNPYARSVAPELVRRPKTEQAAEASTPSHATRGVSGGFSELYARSAEK